MKTKDLEYYRLNAEENYITTPISVLRYITELEATNAKLVEENDFLNTGICVMQEELSAAKERVKELEKINLIKNKLNDELTIMGTNYAVIINKLENETRLFYKIIVFLTVLFFIIKIINIFI